MNILHVLGRARRIGGAEAYALAVAEEQERNGATVAVLHADVNPELNGTPQHFVRDVEAALAWTSGFAPDVVHVHGSPLERSLEERLQAAYPIVRSLHDHALGCATAQRYFRGGSPCTRAHGAGCLANMVVRGCAHRLDLRPVLESYARVGERLPLVRSADAVVVYSAFARDNALRNGVEPARCRVIPYFARRGAEPPDASPERNVAFLGRVSRAKGLDVLLRALARARHAWDRLLVAGDGWQRADCERLTQRLGIAGRIDWLGWLDPAGVVSALRSARVVAVPSRWPEPFGIVGIEAMAQARAVVASRTGGIPEWLDDGETGVLVPPADVNALASALQELLEDDVRAAELGSEGWRRAARFSPEAHLRALDGLYAEVC